jgi:preprotein translocase subunit SecF
MDILGDTRIDWLKYRWYFILVSFIVLSLGVLDAYRKGGLRYGIDFSEGTIVYAKFQTTPQIDVIRNALMGTGLGEAVIQSYDRAELNQVMIRVERKADATGDLDATANQIIGILREIEGNELVDTSTEIVGPVVGQELRRKARNAVLLALLAMLIYIGIRFEFIYGIGATVAIIHDVVLTLTFVSIFNFEVSLNVIAAFMTLVGYSVNDSIVIFDRVRENRRLVRRQSLYEIINLSINQTLRRTVLTSGLTLLVVLALYILGGEVLRGFSFVMVAGVIVGTYSSVAIASPIVIWWTRLRDKPATSKGKTKAKAAAKTARI